jgi:shikimate dehydrogenase
MRVLLLGHPVAHSLSPAIQNAAFAALGLPHVYEAVDIEPDGLAGALVGLREEACLGANVTVPYKLAVASALDAIDADATTLGAVNTIVNTGGRLSGYNTDVEGAWEGLLAPVVDAISGAKVLVIGAGGGARAIMVALSRSLPRGPSEIVVVARRSDQAAATAELGTDGGMATRPAPWWELVDELRTSAVVINCTPLGLEGEDPLEGVPLVGRTVLDMAYRPGGTPLFQRAWEEGSMALQGDQMLLHQGALAFQLWTNQAAPLAAMRAALEHGLR